MSDPLQLRRMGLFVARVPRYTSYPPANQFNAEIGPAETGEWLRAIPDAAAISLYVHIPFCRRLCWFCACRTQGTTTITPVGAYVDRLVAEIGLIARSLPAGVTLSRLHWGGGTPTILDAAAITRLASALANEFPFAPGAEFSVEIDPNEIDEARLDALVAAGMGRATIGIQDFNPEIQRTIGREQSFAVTKRTIDGLRRRGIASLNLDIVYGLPHQTTARLSDLVQRILSLCPDRVALYGYAHVPRTARRQTLIPSDTLPTPEQRLELFETASRLFVWDGFRAIGIDHFARPHDGLARAAVEGRLRRNFQGYTDDSAESLLGLGASAISQFAEGYAQNAPATSEYARLVQSGQIATTRGHRHSSEDRIRGGMIERLMCDFRIDTRALATRLQVPSEAITELLDGVEEAFPGVVRRTESGIEIVDEGKPLTRIVARYFDTYTNSDQTHSPAI